MTDHFAALGEPRRPWLDPEALKEKFHARSAAVHPDRVHGADEATRREADARYAGLNAAYQCLRDPKSRLQHLLQLERGTKPGDIKSIPDDVVQLFGDVGRRLRETDALLADKVRATSPLVKVGVLERALPQLDTLARLQATLVTRREEILRELNALDAAWDGQVQSPGNREAALTAVERLYHLLGFLDRWSAQLQERVVQLTL